jgi:alpha-mannosidase
MGGEMGSTKPKASYPQLAPHPVGQKISHIYRDRINQFFDGGQYGRNNLNA